MKFHSNFVKYATGLWICKHVFVCAGFTICTKTQSVLFHFVAFVSIILYAIKQLLKLHKFMKYCDRASIKRCNYKQADVSFSYLEWFAHNPRRPGKCSVVACNRLKCGVTFLLAIRHWRWFITHLLGLQFWTDLSKANVYSFLPMYDKLCFFVKKGSTIQSTIVRSSIYFVNWVSLQKCSQDMMTLVEVTN